MQLPQAPLKIREYARHTRKYVKGKGALVLAVFIIVAGAGIGAYFLSHKTNLLDEGYWRARVHAVGGKAAYQEFSVFERTQPLRFQHQLSHLFGAALYAEEGPGSLSVCDFRYESGCLHEFFREFSKEYGIGSLQEMAAACGKINGSPGPCEHAIGHGLVTYFGDNKPGLLQALAFCSSHFTSDIVLGCTGGAFMEYNGYQLLDGGSHPREVGPDGWYEPCGGVPEENQRSCTWWLPRWWAELLFPRTEPEAGYQKIGQLCHNIPHQEYRRECFEATGQKIVGIARWDTEQIKKLCGLAGTNAAEILYCRSYAAAMFLYNTTEKLPTVGMIIGDAMLNSGVQGTQEKARLVCADLPPESKAFCEGYATNQHYIYNELPLPAGIR